MHRRPGLGKVEVLLSVLILAVVAGLVLPAIMRTREAGSRSHCANNLKLLALSIHNYNDAYGGKLPALVDQGADTPTGNGIRSLFFIVLPYVEADYLYYVGTTQGPQGYNGPSSTLAFSGTLKGYAVQQWGGSANQSNYFFSDPSDQTAGLLRDVPMTLPDGSTGYYATGSYAANGMIPWNTGGLPRSFADGTENTIMIAERPQVCRTASGETVYNLWGLGFYSPHMPAFAALTPTDPPGLTSTGQVAPVEPLSARDRANELLVRIGRQDAEPRPPDFATPVQMLRGAGACDPRLPATPHRQGMQVAMADGSVRVMARTVSPWVFWAACTPAGGEELPGDW
ncbi:MAG TPA: DUF1559 domain-containing protein [Gemmataceae bacterium]|jgi:prepilin-type processing-associated H-X9-DG protein